jgi:uncharacterized phage-associated protein
MTYNPRKAAQTIAYFAIKNGRSPINVLKAIKLLYLADRESIRRFGFPIQDEVRVSMPHGPVNSSTYEYICGVRNPDECGWSDFLRDRSNHRISLANDAIGPDSLDELSEADISVLDGVWDQFGPMDQWTLRDWTHNPSNVPEWEDPGNSSREIPLVRMMRALGVADPERQAELVQDFGDIDRLLLRLS